MQADGANRTLETGSRGVRAGNMSLSADGRLLAFLWNASHGDVTVRVVDLATADDWVEDSVVLARSAGPSFVAPDTVLPPPQPLGLLEMPIISADDSSVH